MDLCNSSTSLHSIVIRQPSFRPVFGPLISTSYIQRDVLDELHSASCFGRVTFSELFWTSYIQRVVFDEFSAYYFVDQVKIMEAQRGNFEEKVLVTLKARYVMIRICRLRTNS